MIVVHNRDRLEIFQISLIEHTPKAAFRALDYKMPLNWEAIKVRVMQSDTFHFM